VKKKAHATQTGKNHPHQYHQLDDTNSVHHLLQVQIRQKFRKSTWGSTGAPPQGPGTTLMSF